ncbi:MAG: class I SAM-dependent DNA methyltransferase [[Ruminococcus] torques]
MEAYTSFAYVYDTFMDNVPYGEWARHIREKLCEHGVTDGIVLDLGCGTGTMTERLARYGYDMIGVDNSEEMLELAMEKKTESGYDILYLLQDMRGFELYGTVRAVVSVCDSVNYITEPDELEEVFRLVNNYLDPKGIFLFDFNTVHKYRDVIGDSTIAEDRGVCSFIWDNRYYEKEQINEYDLTLFIAEDFNPMENAYVSERTADSEDALLSEEGAGDLEDTMFSEEEGGENGSLYRRYTETHYQRGYTLAEIQELLERAGLVFIEAYDADTKETPNDMSERICVIARENGK